MAEPTRAKWRIPQPIAIEGGESAGWPAKFKKARTVVYTHKERSFVQLDCMGSVDLLPALI